MVIRATKLHAPGYNGTWNFHNGIKNFLPILLHLAHDRSRMMDQIFLSFLYWLSLSCLYLIPFFLVAFPSLSFGHSILIPLSNHSFFSFMVKTFPHPCCSFSLSYTCSLFLSFPCIFWPIVSPLPLLSPSPSHYNIHLSLILHSFIPFITYFPPSFLLHSFPIPTNCPSCLSFSHI